MLAFLAVFTVSAIAGIVILSAATAALHGGSAKKARQEPRIQKAATVHIVLLCLGVLLLGGRLVDRVLTETPKAPPTCCVPPNKP